MRRNKEILVLLGLLAAMMGFVLWYVIDRRAKLRAMPASPAVAPQTAGQTPAAGTKTTPPKP